MGRADIAYGVTFLCLSLLVCIGAASLPLGSLLSPGPGLYPLILGLGLGITSLLLVIMGVLGKKVKDTELSSQPLQKRKLLSTIGALFTYVTLLNYAGYLIATFLFFSFLFGVQQGKKWGLTVSFAIFIALLSYFLFSFLLGIPFPRGLVGQIIFS